ncbi:cell division protein PerM [Streptomyces mangrovi]|uniref:cell division protein PerM n=1 Tax=Streptomyces mangrovi TaxID=1206892 RepID=UPI00399C65EC
MTRRDASPSSPPPHALALIRHAPVPPRDRLLDGVMAAGLGLGGIAVLVMLLWITSPHPDDGPGGALRIAADLWLVAHGAPLVRTETLSGSPAPVGLVPLLLCAVPVWLLHRTARGAARGPVSARAPGGSPGTDPGAGDTGAAWRAMCWIVAGYLLVAVAVTGYAASGPIRVDPLGAALRLPAVTAAVAAAGTWTGLGRPLPEAPPRLLRRTRRTRRTRRMRRRTERPALTRAGASAALRGAAASAAAQCAGGALLTAGALLWHVATAQRAAFPSQEQPTLEWPGLAAVLLLALALTPNAAVWGAAYGLGPGFTLGGGSTVRPAAVTGLPPLPDFPLLAAVPAEGPGTPVTWAAALVVPLAGGLLAAWCVARAAVPAGGGPAVLGGRATAGAAALAACGCGAAMAALAACAGGPLGTGALAHIGPDWRLTGAAALGWTAALGVPTALAMRSWRLRPARGH